MTTITDGKGKTVAQFDDAKLAVRCIGPMARACGFVLTIKSPPKALGVELPKNVTFFNESPSGKENTLIARP